MDDLPSNFLTRKSTFWRVNERRLLLLVQVLLCQCTQSVLRSRHSFLYKHSSGQLNRDSHTVISCHLSIEWSVRDSLKFPRFSNTPGPICRFEKQRIKFPMSKSCDSIRHESLAIPTHKSAPKSQEYNIKLQSGSFQAKLLISKSVLVLYATNTSNKPSKQSQPKHSSSVAHQNTSDYEHKRGRKFGY